MSEKVAESMRRVRTGSERTKEFVERIGNALVDYFHLLALFAIGGTVVWSAAFAFIGMVAKGHATVEDILLLFIYLELGAMVGIYFKTNHMPVRFLLYVAITALTRLLISFINVQHELDIRILTTTGGIVLLAFAVLVLRYGSFTFPAAGLVKTDADFADADKAA